MPGTQEALPKALLIILIEPRLTPEFIIFSLHLFYPWDLATSETSGSVSFKNMDPQVLPQMFGFSNFRVDHRRIHH